MPEDVSVLDKTDWRDTIHKTLERAVFQIGHGDTFVRSVETAIEAIVSDYPGWNAVTEVNKIVASTVKKYETMLDRDIMTNHIRDWQYPWVKVLVITKYQNAMYREILREVKNVAGRRRMLLWGVRHTVKGRQMSDDGTETVD